MRQNFPFSLQESKEFPADNPAGGSYERPRRAAGLHTDAYYCTGGGQLDKVASVEVKTMGIFDLPDDPAQFSFHDSGRVSSADASDLIERKNFHSFSGRAVYGGFGKLRDGTCCPRYSKLLVFLRETGYPDDDSDRRTGC